MRTSIDLSPFYRSSIGFDRIFNLLENATGLQAVDDGPSYDIAKTGEDDYRITMAVPGFTPEELEVTQEEHLLVVKGDKRQDDEGVEYLHRGIATRSFSSRFELADHVKALGARLENGMLVIDLRREVPEALKPRRIDIQTEAPAPRAIEQQKKAA